MKTSRTSLLRSVTASLGACALLALSACGGSSDADAKATPKAATNCEAAPADAGAAKTRTVKDTYLGDVEDVPTQPQRIVALWRTGSELADLCVVPVGSLQDEFTEDELGPELFEDFDDIPTVGTYEGVDVEKLIELEPDLIIGMDHGALSINYDEIKEIAPTVILPIEEPTDVWDNYPEVAELVGMSTDFGTRSAEVDAELAAIKDEYAAKLKGVSATSLNFADTLYADTSKSLTWRRIDGAGFGYNKAYATDPERYITELAMENLPDLADQDIIFFEAGNDGEPKPEVQEVLDSESFKRLPAARAGNVFPLATGTNYTIAAAHEQVEDLRAAAEAYTPAS